MHTFMGVLVCGVPMQNFVCRKPALPAEGCRIVALQEIAEFEAFARQPQLHDELFRGIAPKIYRSENIKKALACLLFGGSRKVRN